MGGDGVVGERSGDVPIQGAWVGARVCCAPRFLIAPRAGHRVARALIALTQTRLGWPSRGAFPDAILPSPGSWDPGRRDATDRAPRMIRRNKRTLPMALTSKKRARPTTRSPNDDPYAMGFGTALAKVFASSLTPTVRSRRCHRGVSGPASGTSSSGKSWVRESAHRQAANRAASGRSAVPQA
jgi:hypothetical protein